MSNMSYCRFQNTLIDMRDCLDDLSVSSYDEFIARERLVQVARDFISAYESEYYCDDLDPRD